MKAYYTPAEAVIKIFGGIRKTARLLNRDPKAVMLWQDPKTKRGREGLIPSSVQRRILEIAREKGLPITTRMIIYGYTVKVEASDG